MTPTHSNDAAGHSGDSTQRTDQSAQHAGHRTPGTALLAFSAVVLGALLLVQVARLGLLPAARAEMVSEVGDFAVMTTSGGNDEVLLVLDNRSEDLSVYRVENQSALELYQRVNLHRIFT